ncbi:uncharacterized protein PHACADRAFT_251013 [Phanerochaete carnosa HHB-10118-sp]|uniref:Uncharacterized protein n=1 Tax=Phanerochaete carnosa (strain HHB-10118-sp) TaxID=650164 RepID=K5W837_PHACS|nr:uncharacterized protein PHACADRAFT_251013 [Phanerochaete carnosa HHB-10118-sp]EKM60118.1 hypothetical protein PHACADRAFT_251013 [Phanerochaete carnosa HHB-10118-sp]
MSLSHTTSQMQPTSPGQAHPQGATYASGYSQAYANNMSSAASALPQPGPASGVSSYNGNTVSVGVYSSSQIEPSHAGQPGSSDSHCSYPQSSYSSYGSQNYVSQPSASHARSSSPPVHLAPIQTDRLVHRSGSIPSLPALSSATSMASQSHYGSGLHDVPRSAPGAAAWPSPRRIRPRCRTRTRPSSTSISSISSSSTTTARCSTRTRRTRRSPRTARTTARTAGGRSTRCTAGAASRREFARARHASPIRYLLSSDLLGSDPHASYALYSFIGYLSHCIFFFIHLDFSLGPLIMYGKHASL